MGIVPDTRYGILIGLVVYEIVITHFHDLIGRKETEEKGCFGFLRLP